MNREVTLNTIIPEELAGKRLDQALAHLFSEHSRSRLQGWIKAGMVKLNNEVVDQRYKLKGGETVEIQAQLESQIEHRSEEIPLNIVFEDEDILIINKPAGLVVHPGAGNASNTLLNALLHHDPKLELVARAGIVHRLDKDTTGLMVIAKNPESHTFLVDVMQERSIKREYQALVRGYLTAGSTINEPIGRHPKQRTKMAVNHSGKEAITHYRVKQHFPDFTLLNCQLETGRTHQIRVHMAHIKHPIVGDPAYGGRFALPKGANEALKQALQRFKRQALHAWRLALPHPKTEEIIEFEAPLPEDFHCLLDVIKQENHGR